MTNAEIEAFLAVVDYGTVSAAAEHLFVTQPALSRRIKNLEEEIGYLLFQRQKGIREIRLTKEGEEFLAVAGKWRRLWEETSAIAGDREQKRLALSSVGSVSSYIFPEVFRNFLDEDPRIHLTFHQYTSREAYGYVEQRLTDLAFVSDQRYARRLKVMPAFSEPYVLAGTPRLKAAGAGTTGNLRAAGEMATGGLGSAEAVTAEDLDPAAEVRLPWTVDYDQWHVRHFPDTVYPHVFLNQMSLMEEFLRGETWALVPATVGCKLEKRGIPIGRIQDGPPDRLIYYLVHEENENPLIGRFLHHLDAYLRTLEAVRSFL